MDREIETPQTNRLLTTPHAAAVAGIISGVLFFVSQWLINLATDDIRAGSKLSADRVGSLSVAFQLVALAGIAFLWFIGVARDRLGRKEDQFFATVFLGSGLLYLAMTFTAGALETGLLTAGMAGDITLDHPIFRFAASVIYETTYVFGFRMASVFMLSSATMWLRTQVMPHWLAILTVLFALVLLVSIGISTWVTLIFPVWMVVVSIVILIANLRRPAKGTLGREPHPGVS
jgi:hypothetical protein